jgi:hypothetical protein
VKRSEESLPTPRLIQGSVCICVVLFARSELEETCTGIRLSKAFAIVLVHSLPAIHIPISQLDLDLLQLDYKPPYLYPP